MFNVKLYTTFNFLFVVIFSLKKKTIHYFLFQTFKLWIAVSLKKLFVSNDFLVLNGILSLERDIYLSIVKFLDSPILRKVWVNIFGFF
jgi:hypothetical protein